MNGTSHLNLTSLPSSYYNNSMSTKDSSYLSDKQSNPTTAGYLVLDAKTGSSILVDPPHLDSLHSTDTTWLELSISESPGTPRTSSKRSRNNNGSIETNFLRKKYKIDG